MDQSFLRPLSTLPRPGAVDTSGWGVLVLLFLLESHVVRVAHHAVHTAVVAVVVLCGGLMSVTVAQLRNR